MIIAALAIAVFGFLAVCWILYPIFYLDELTDRKFCAYHLRHNDVVQLPPRRRLIQVKDKLRYVDFPWLTMVYDRRLGQLQVFHSEKKWNNYNEAYHYLRELDGHGHLRGGYICLGSGAKHIRKYKHSIYWMTVFEGEPEMDDLGVYWRFIKGRTVLRWYWSIFHPFSF